MIGTLSDSSSVLSRSEMDSCFRMGPFPKKVGLYWYIGEALKCPLAETSPKPGPLFEVMLAVVMVVMVTIAPLRWPTHCFFGF